MSCLSFSCHLGSCSFPDFCMASPSGSSYNCSWCCIAGFDLFSSLFTQRECFASPLNCSQSYSILHLFRCVFLPVRTPSGFVATRVFPPLSRLRVPSPTRSPHRVLMFILGFGGLFWVFFFFLVLLWNSPVSLVETSGFSPFPPLFLSHSNSRRTAARAMCFFL